jgi:pimeloyl-ACP methyl ester carboxylesterase
MSEFLLEDTKIIYDISGKGTPIVFIHPPAMGRMVFHFQKKLNHYFTIIIPDLSGNGDSIGPEKMVTIKGYADEIKGLLDYLQINKAVICGYSAGSCIAQEFALQFPERTLGLILISGYPEVMSLSFKYEHIIGMYLVKRFPALLRYLIASSHTNNPILRNKIINHMKKANHDMWSQYYEQSLHYRCTDKLHLISVPMLLVYGAKDFANQHFRAYKKYTKFQCVILPNVSHQLPMKSWQELNQSIIGFILEKFKRSH